MPSCDSHWSNSFSRVTEENSENRYFDSIRSDDRDCAHENDDDGSTMNSDGVKINTFSPPFVEMRLLYCLCINLHQVTSRNSKTEDNIRVTMSLTTENSEITIFRLNK